MKSKLKNIAEISLGLTFRTRLEPQPSGNTRVIQMKDLDNDNKVHLENAVKINSPLIKKSKMRAIQKDTIIFSSRGRTIKAALFSKANYSENTIVAAPLFCIKPKKEIVYPEYLLWYINSPDSQAYFNSRLEGTSIPIINKTTLEDWEVELPPLKKQKQIADLYKVFLQEKSLLKRILQKKNKHIQAVLSKLAKSHSQSNPQQKEALCTI